MGILDALRAGNALRNAGTWANKAAAAQALAAVLSLLAALAPLAGVRLDLDAETIQQLAGGIAAVGFIVFGYLHTATNPAAGLPARVDPAAVVRPTQPGAGLPPAASSGNDRGSDAPGNSQPPPPPQFTG